MDKTLTSTEHDESFYFDDDPMSIFLVGNRLFKVHRHYLIQESEVFRNMFSSHAEGESDSAEGTCDEHPIVLPGVTVTEFQALLRFFYQLHVPHRCRDEINGRPRVLGVDGLTLDEQLALLSISHRFLFEDVLGYVLGQIEVTSVPIVDRIRLGDKYGCSDWLLSAYKGLLESPPQTSPTGEELEALGPERIISLFKAKYFMSQERLLIAKKELKAGVCKCACKQCKRCLTRSGVPREWGTPTATDTVIEKFFMNSDQLLVQDLNRDASE